jgi:hypothetical protein
LSGLRVLDRHGHGRNSLSGSDIEVLLIVPAWELANGLRLFVEVIRGDEFFDLHKLLTFQGVFQAAPVP